MCMNKCILIIFFSINGLKHYDSIIVYDFFYYYLYPSAICESDREKWGRVIKYKARQANKGIENEAVLKYKESGVIDDLRWRKMV